MIIPLIGSYQSLNQMHQAQSTIFAASEAQMGLANSVHPGMNMNQINQLAAFGAYLERQNFKAQVDQTFAEKAYDFWNTRVKKSIDMWFAGLTSSNR